jgi:hypothetical protein
LFRAVEAAALAAGATSSHIDASLAAVEFYKANGFEEVGRGEHRLSSGGSMPFVFMRKRLTPGPDLGRNNRALLRWSHQGRRNAGTFRCGKTDSSRLFSDTARMTVCR